MRIQHNIAALNSYRQLGGNNSAVSKNLEKLSSGYRINRAGDDAAGLAISEKMRAQITGLETAQKNAEDGISLVQTAEGNLQEVHSMLNRMVELATQASNGTYSDDNRKELQKEIASLNEEIDRIASSANFNGTKLLDGSLDTARTTELTFDGASLNTSVGKAFEGTIQIVAAAGTEKDTIQVTATANALTITLGSQDASTYTAEGINAAVKAAVDEALKADSLTDSEKKSLEALQTFTLTADSAIEVKKDDTTDTTATTVGEAGSGLTLQVGDTNEDYQKVTVSVGKMDAASLGIGGIDISTQEGAAEAVDKIKTAIDKVSSARGDLGALQNRLDHTINNLGVAVENMTAAESRIRDTDMAKEMMDFTKNNILTQAAQAMLAQANMVPQGVLQLLQ